MAAPTQLQHQQTTSRWVRLAVAGCLVLALTAATLPGANADQPDFLNAPTVSECRVHIEAALKHVGQQEETTNHDVTEEEQQGDEADVESTSNEEITEPAGPMSEGGEVESQESTISVEEQADGSSTLEDTTHKKTAVLIEEYSGAQSAEEKGEASMETTGEETASIEETSAEADIESMEETDASDVSAETAASDEATASDEAAASTEENASIEEGDSAEEESLSVEENTGTASETLQHEADSVEETAEDASVEIPEAVSQEIISAEQTEGSESTTAEILAEHTAETSESTEGEVSTEESVEGEAALEEETEIAEDTSVEIATSAEDLVAFVEDIGSVSEETETTGELAPVEEVSQESVEVSTTEHSPDATEPSTEEAQEGEASTEATESTEGSVEESQESAEVGSSVEVPSEDTLIPESQESIGQTESSESSVEGEQVEETEQKSRQRREAEFEEGGTSTEVATEQEASNATEAGAAAEELAPEIIIPTDLRPKDHVSKILRLDADSVEPELLLSKTVDSTLRELKRLYDTAIKPLEILYKYRDLSNRHFGDPEIFSKPLILFMGPWSGGKSTIINYLMDIEYTNTALRTGAEPSPAYFNILMYGDHEEVLDGTQLAADWTFSGLQKFGQGLLDRLRGLKLNNRLLEKVNIVEIPGILEIRKQVERVFPFNDACQWFIDRADVIFLVYDPSKLDVGPETEAILDQLKGREYQTRIILNKADQVRPEELMRVQGTLIWNISPLMSSSEPPVMYSTSLWAVPYEPGAPTRLLYAQEIAFLRDIRDAITKRVENKIASARRFAVRVRNHAKMVDCYLTTYYNHKTLFGNKQKISDDIIEHPQNYHIYEGLSTLTNISRYDLPDPEVYRDFFKLNPLYEFQQLSATCTYFRGCPINRLDVAIAYDLPELVGKYKKAVEEVLASVTMKS